MRTHCRAAHPLRRNAFAASFVRSRVQDNDARLVEVAAGAEAGQAPDVWAGQGKLDLLRARVLRAA